MNACTPQLYSWYNAHTLSWRGWYCITIQELNIFSARGPNNSVLTVVLVDDLYFVSSLGIIAAVN